MPTVPCFASALVMFGACSNNPNGRIILWDDLLDLAKSVINPASYVQTEFLALVQKAKKTFICPKRKKRRVAKK